MTVRCSPRARSSQDARRESHGILLADDPRTPQCRLPNGFRAADPPPSCAPDGRDIAPSVEPCLAGSAGSSPAHDDATRRPPPQSTTASNTVAGGRPIQTTGRTPSAGTAAGVVVHLRLDLDHFDDDSAPGPSGRVHSLLVKPRGRAAYSLPGRSSIRTTQPAIAAPPARSTQTLPDTLTHSELAAINFRRCGSDGPATVGPSPPATDTCASRHL